ncbi:hypothetical protein [Nocardioides luteus]|uniref:hypothetical protein n=1 Tax=Nocardioides luteus TaxID=1844 RepID=UPI0018CA322B|nr:hypothetical protein [Nocardioides luteus]MBG6096391.1 hypothetical protein [Nocardioides luteus]
MSRRRSAFATMAVVAVFCWFYSFALAVPVDTGNVSSLWQARGHEWFGAFLARVLDGLSFLWGSVVRYEYAAAPESAWPALVFVVLLAGSVYASLRTGGDGAYAVAGRVLGASFLAGGLTNLFVIVEAAVASPYGTAQLAAMAWSRPDDGIWLALSLGVVGSVVAAYVVTLVQLAAAVSERAEREDPPASATVPRLNPAQRRVRAVRVATWGALPTLALAFGGGFVWDYGPDVYTDAAADARQGWVHVVWFTHASLAPPDDPYSLGGTFDTLIWLPRTLSSVVLVALIWLAIRLVVARWQRGAAPSVLGVVMGCWGMVAVLAVVVGLVEGAVFPVPELAPPAYNPPAYTRAFDNVADALRFAAFFGWATGVVVALALRLSGGTLTEPETAEPVPEGSMDR